MYLKHRTAQNIVIGGLAGALPPVIAWISISNEIYKANLLVQNKN